MAHMLICDPLEELRHLIDRQHLSYLQGDNGSEDRRKLESSMREYLCKVPHDHKFSCPQTADVLRRSIRSRQNFNGDNAARAFGAIARYADNLIIQPWRKEFREIKLYCGFYKHEVEEHLVGAEQMLEAMGYRHAGNSTMTLPDVLDIDRAVCVSRDAMLARVECSIMQQIWTAMSVHHVSWAQILEHRENCTGTPEQAFRALTYRIHVRLYQQQQQQQQISHRPRQSPCAYYGNHSMHHASHSYPTARYAHIVSPQQIVPPPAMYQSPMIPSYPQQPVLKPHEMYPSNGYHMHNAYPNVPLPAHNGYSSHSNCHYNLRPSVPTGQLIELSQDSSPAHIHQPYPVPEPLQTTELPSSKAKDDGAGAWENWDYVFRNLENQGYRKDTNLRESHQSNRVDSEVSDRMRGMNLSPTERYKPPPVSPPKRLEDYTRTEGDGEAKQRLRKNSSDLDDAVPKHKSNKPSLNINCDDSGNRFSKAIVDDVDSSSRKKILKNSEMTQEERPKKIVEKESNECLQVRNEGAAPVRKSPEVTRNIVEPARVVTLDVSPTFLREVSPVVELPPEEGDWECAKCTFLNSRSRNVCEMCGKSKMSGVELAPQPCGGFVCPTCTLVNERGKNFCSACGGALKGSPTYI